LKKKVFSSEAVVVTLLRYLMLTFCGRAGAMYLKFIGFSCDTLRENRPLLFLIWKCSSSS